jgi:hypothetical protein
VSAVRSRIGVARAIGSCVFTFASLRTAPRAALADDAAPEILWTAPPECPSVKQLRAEIDRLLARPQTRSRAMVEVSAEVTRDSDDAGPYRLRLVITDREGGTRERRIDGESCAEVADAAAVVIALASDDDALPPPLPPPPPVEPPPTPSDQQDAGAPVEPSLPPASPPAAWDIIALGGVDVASLPAPTPGFGLGLGLTLSDNRFELRAAAWLPQRATLGALSSVGGDVALYAAELRYCRAVVEGAIDLAPCVGFEAGALRASSVGVASPVSGLGPWLAPELGLVGAVHPASRLTLSLELDGLAPLARDRFVISGAGQVFQPPWVTGRAVLGVHVRFP